MERENEIKSETQTMPPKKRKKNETNGKTEAQDAVLEDEEIVRGRQVSTKIYQSALSSRIVSSTLPSTAEVIQTRNRQLFKSDAKDIVKTEDTGKNFRAANGGLTPNVGTMRLKKAQCIPLGVGGGRFPT